MSNRAEQAAMEVYPSDIYSGGKSCRRAYKEGYEQAVKDLKPALEFPFDVPDDDGYLVFTSMNNSSIRKKLKLKNGEGVIISIRSDKRYGNDKS